jgi:hypothetical protein
MLSYTYINLFSKEDTLHGNRKVIHTIPKMSTQSNRMENNSILEIELSKENGGGIYYFFALKEKSEAQIVCFHDCIVVCPQR